ncbi:unnamed protein product [Closterium sp. NIES-65]|nr:unnamed protein product [Closterium sp. NIES-65]
MRVQRPRPPSLHASATPTAAFSACECNAHGRLLCMRVQRPRPPSLHASATPTAAFSACECNAHGRLLCMRVQRPRPPSLHASATPTAAFSACECNAHGRLLCMRVQRPRPPSLHASATPTAAFSACECNAHGRLLCMRVQRPRPPSLHASATPTAAFSACECNAHGRLLCMRVQRPRPPSLHASATPTAAFSACECNAHGRLLCMRVQRPRPPSLHASATPTAAFSACECNAHGRLLCMRVQRPRPPSLHASATPTAAFSACECNAYAYGGLPSPSVSLHSAFGFLPPSNAVCFLMFLSDSKAWSELRRWRERGAVGCGASRRQQWREEDGAAAATRDALLSEGSRGMAGEDGSSMRGAAAYSGGRIKAGHGMADWRAGEDSSSTRGAAAYSGGGMEGGWRAEEDGAPSATSNGFFHKGVWGRGMADWRAGEDSSSTRGAAAYSGGGMESGWRAEEDGAPSAISNGFFHKGVWGSGEDWTALEERQERMEQHGGCTTASTGSANTSSTSMGSDNSSTRSDNSSTRSDNSSTRSDNSSTRSDNSSANISPGGTRLRVPNDGLHLTVVFGCNVRGNPGGQEGPYQGSKEDPSKCNGTSHLRGSIMAYDADQEALRGVAYVPLEIEDPPEPANSRRATARDPRQRSSTGLGFRSKRDYNEFHEFHEFQAALDQDSQARTPSESRLQTSNLQHRLGAAEIDVHPNLNSRFGAAELDVQLGPPDLTEEGAREEVGEDWRRVGDVDGFMRGVYEYYCGRGFVCMVTSVSDDVPMATGARQLSAPILHFPLASSLAFTILFSALLLLLIDWRALLSLNCSAASAAAAAAAISAAPHATPAAATSGGFAATGAGERPAVRTLAETRGEREWREGRPYERDGERSTQGRGAGAMNGVGPDTIVNSPVYRGSYVGVYSGGDGSRVEAGALQDAIIPGERRRRLVQGSAAEERVAAGTEAERGLAGERVVVEGRVAEGAAEGAAEAAMHEAEGAAEGACNVLKHAIRRDVFRRVTVWEVTVTAYLALLCLYWLLCFAHFFLRLPALLETRALFRHRCVLRVYRHRLRLSDHQLLMTPWPAVVARLVRAWNDEGAGEMGESAGERAGGGGEEDSSEDEEEGEQPQEKGERGLGQWLEADAAGGGGISGMGVVRGIGGRGAGRMCGGRARVGGLSAYEVAARITRRDNYLVALVDSRLLTVRVPAGGGHGGSGSTGAALAAALLSAVGPLLSFHVVHERRRRKGRKGRGEEREEEREEGCVRVTVLSKTLEWVVHWCVLHPLLDRHGRLHKHFLDDPAALRQRFILSGWLLALLSPFVLLFVLSFFLLRKAHHLYHEPAAAGVRSWSNLARWMFKEYNEVDHLTSQRLDEACPRADEYLAQFPSPLLALAAKLLSFVAGSLAALLLALALADEKLLEAQLFGRGLVWYAAILGAVLAAARPVAQADRAAGSVDPKGALLRAARHTHFLPTRWRSKAHTQRVRDEFQTLYQVKVCCVGRVLSEAAALPRGRARHLHHAAHALVHPAPGIASPRPATFLFLPPPSHCFPPSHSSSLPFPIRLLVSTRTPSHMTAVTSRHLSRLSLPLSTPSAHLPIPQRADAILAFLRTASTYQEGLGHVCSHSAFQSQGERRASSSGKSAWNADSKGDDGASDSGQGGAPLTSPHPANHPLTALSHPPLLPSPLPTLIATQITVLPPPPHPLSLLSLPHHRIHRKLSLPQWPLHTLPLCNHPLTVTTLYSHH